MHINGYFCVVNKEWSISIQRSLSFLFSFKEWSLLLLLLLDSFAYIHFLRILLYTQSLRWGICSRIKNSCFSLNQCRLNLKQFKISLEDIKKEIKSTGILYLSLFLNHCGIFYTKFINIRREDLFLLFILSSLGFLWSH